MTYLAELKQRKKMLLALNDNENDKMIEIIQEEIDELEAHEQEIVDYKAIIDKASAEWKEMVRNDKKTKS